jgi:hypothetical protein
MNTVTLRVRPSDIQSLIAQYTEKTGVECRACSAEKAFYLDSHVCTKVGEKEIPVGVQFEMLLRVLCRWVVYFRPQVTTVEKAFEVVRFQLCSLEFSLCTVDQFHAILHMKYDGGNRKGGGFVIKNDLAKHLQSCWELIYLPLYLEMKNPSFKWLGKFMFPNNYLAATLPMIFEAQYRSLMEDIERLLPITAKDWASNNVRSNNRGILSMLMSERSGTSVDAATLTDLISDGTLWRVVGILLSFYFKIYPVLIPTKNNLFFCYLCTFEFLYSDQSWTSPGELRHRMGELFDQCQRQFKSLLFSEHEILCENEEFIRDLGVAFSLYTPPVKDAEKEEEVNYDGFDEAEKLLIRTEDEDNFPSKKRFVNVTMLMAS